MLYNRIIWSGDYTSDMFKRIMDIDDRYELKPEFKKKQLEQEINALEDNVQSLTSIIGEQKKKLEDKKKELKDIK